MYVATIPTIHLLDFTADARYHMMLPKPFMKSTAYAEFYSNATGHKILDNGEAEGLRLSTNELIKMAHYLNATEIVVPDFLGNCNKTIYLARQFEEAAMASPEFQYMGVVQGQTHAEFMKCATSMMYTEYITCIGVPRAMIRILGNKWCRAAFIETLERSEFTKPIHCLGASSWVKEVVLLSELPNVRSIDTSLPFVLGLDGIDIKEGLYIDRQSDYFNRDADYHTREVILDNILTYREWANDREDGPVFA